MTVVQTLELILFFMLGVIVFQLVRAIFDPVPGMSLWDKFTKKHAPTISAQNNQVPPKVKSVYEAINTMAEKKDPMDVVMHPRDVYAAKKLAKKLIKSRIELTEEEFNICSHFLKMRDDGRPNYPYKNVDGEMVKTSGGTNIDDINAILGQLKHPLKGTNSFGPGLGSTSIKQNMQNNGIPIPKPAVKTIHQDNLFFQLVEKYKAQETVDYMIKNKITGCYHNHHII